jgi:hypothetical protein
MTIRDFKDCLFDEEDRTCFSETPRGITIRPFPYVTKDYTFFSINPMDPTKTRADAAVTKYRNFLVEMDKVPLDQQDQHISEIDMPYSTAVFSGSKSIHYIISLEETLPDEQSYRALVKRIYKAVGYEKVDVSCKNPSRFSRLPDHIRSDTGKEQKLLFVGRRVPNTELETWLQKRGVEKEDLWENLTPEPRSTFKNPSRLYGSTKNFLMFGVQENWNISLFKAAADLCRCGYTEDEAVEELLKVTGTLDFSDRKTIGSAFKNELSKTTSP